MAIALTPAGSATISTTEYSLPRNANYSAGSPQTADGYVETEIDFSALAAGDQYRVRIYEQINGGGQRIAWEATVNGVQSYPLLTPLYILGEGWDVTVLKLAGTDRAVGWSVRSAGQTGSFLLNSHTVSTTEYSLPANANYSAGSPQTPDEFVEAWIDTAAVAAGDVYRYRLYEKINGVSQVLDEQTPLPGMGPVIFRRRIVGEGWDVTALKVSGTDRSIAWSIRVDTNASGGGGDATAPTASATFPASSSYTTVRDQAVSIPVSDPDDAIGLVAISVKFAGYAKAETIYIGGGSAAGFMPGYAQFSGITGNGSAGVGYTFSVRRDDSWPKGVAAVFTVRACDAHGNVLS